MLALAYGEQDGQRHFRKRLACQPRVNSRIQPT
jgi:hypothetical protein